MANFSFFAEGDAAGPRPSLLEERRQRRLVDGSEAGGEEAEMALFVAGDREAAGDYGSPAAGSSERAATVHRYQAASDKQQPAASCSRCKAESWPSWGAES